MPQLEGGLTVDEGYRVGVAGGSPSTTPGPARTRSFDPADHTDESLGVKVYGAEAWTFPGMGEPHPECGDYRIEGVCESCGEPHFAPHQCGRRECPNCDGIWMKDTAVTRATRLQSVRHNAEHKQVAHAVVSPEEPPQTTKAYLDGRTGAADIASEKGFTDFDVIAHPCRVTDEGKELFEEERVADDGRGIHVWLKDEYGGRYTFGMGNSLLYWSPHYHIIGRTSRDMDPAKDSDEMVYKFIDSLPRYSLSDTESHESVYGVYRYLLSHVGIHTERQFQAVVGYGGLSNNSYKDAKACERITSRIERLLEEIAEHPVEDDGPDRAGPDSDELGECDHCDDGTVINVFRLRDYIEQARPPPDIRDRMRVAYEWRRGLVSPPAGAKRPQSPEDAREAFEAMLPVYN